MSLSDLMSGMRLIEWPLVALLIFLGVFVGVLVWVFTRPRAQIEHCARLPIADDQPARE